MPFLSAKHGRLHYESIGDGRPIIMIHGFTNYGLSWAQQVPELVHAGYRVILPDLYGHGQSQPAERPLTVPDLADGIIDLMHHLGIPRAILCGLSLGGMVAQQIAVTAPARVEALVVANSRATFAEPELVDAVEGWINVFLQPDGPLKRLAITWPLLLNAKFRESASGHAALNAWKQALAGVPGPSLANVAKGMTQFDVRDRIPEITAPTCVISGDQDKLFPPEKTAEIASAIRSAVFHTIEGGGHISSMDSPDHFNRLLLDFLRSCAPAAVA
jgi:3-oxoadipate enol-lactonase